MGSVTATVTRKPSGEPLALEILLGSDDIQIPKTNKIQYSVRQEKNGKIMLTPEGVS